MQKLVQKYNKFVQFSDLIEGAPHGLVHFTIGGKKGDFSGMMSPNDPFFWLHHTYLDKLWNDWQRHSPERFRQYNGKHRGRQVDASDRMSPWNLPIYETFNILDLCYEYLPFSKQKFQTGKSSNEILQQTDPIDSAKNLQLKQTDKTVLNMLVDGDLVESIEEFNNAKQASPIPDEWIKHHGLDLEKFRKNEKIINDLENEDEPSPADYPCPTSNSANRQKINLLLSLFCCAILLLF